MSISLPTGAGLLALMIMRFSLLAPLACRSPWAAPALPSRPAPRTWPPAALPAPPRLCSWAAWHSAGSWCPWLASPAATSSGRLEPCPSAPGGWVQAAARARCSRPSAAEGCGGWGGRGAGAVRRPAFTAHLRISQPCQLARSLAAVPGRPQAIAWPARGLRSRSSGSVPSAGQPGPDRVADHPAADAQTPSPQVGGLTRLDHEHVTALKEAPPACLSAALSSGRHPRTCLAALPAGLRCRLARHALLAPRPRLLAAWYPAAGSGRRCVLFHAPISDPPYCANSPPMHVICQAGPADTPPAALQAIPKPAAARHPASKALATTAQATAGAASP